MRKAMMALTLVLMMVLPGCGFWKAVQTPLDVTIATLKSAQTAINLGLPALEELHAANIIATKDYIDVKQACAAASLILPDTIAALEAAKEAGTEPVDAAKVEIAAQKIIAASVKIAIVIARYDVSISSKAAK